jgi:hypothetical protein
MATAAEHAEGFSFDLRSPAFWRAGWTWCAELIHRHRR